MSAFPPDENGQLLEEMQQAGVDLSQPCTITFIQLFEQKSQAETMMAFVQSEYPQYQCAVVADDTPNVWDVNCSIEMLPSHQKISEQEQFFTELARQFDGYNDGWEARIE